MKFLLILMLVILSFATAEDAEPQVGDEVAISVQNQSIYPMPAFYASPVVPVNYGTIAAIDEINGEWYRITTSLGQIGWIHRTSVTGAIQAASGGTSTSGSVTSDEIMLAGRGFSQAIEESYAGQHPELNFSMVDNMQTSWTVSPQQLYQFLVNGNLIEGTASTTPPETPSTEGRTRG
ncbi:MAG: hypothetical protein GQ565_08545 [Candidatus Aegiribacteria sp.]|nr:hypothetical protein [Candidatus Aegiribacteria sp.]